jgi:hypothetical protein
MAGPTGLTFNSLKGDIRRYVERGDPLDESVFTQIPRVINRSENDLADELKILGYLTPTVSTMQAGEPRIAKPEGWRATASINYGIPPDDRRRTLRLRSYEYIRAISPSNTKVGAPRNYAEYNLQYWLVLPIPAGDYPFEANCYIQPPLLSDDTQTNYLTDLAPNLLLFKCLSNMESFLKNDARVPIWKQEYTERFGAITGEDFKRMADRGLVRSTT